jgi:hypothetical protein
MAATKATSCEFRVKNPVLPHGASSKEKAILAIHPRSSGRGILAFSRKTWAMGVFLKDPVSQNRKRSEVVSYRSLLP